MAQVQVNEQQVAFSKIGQFKPYSFFIEVLEPRNHGLTIDNWCTHNSKAAEDLRQYIEFAFQSWEKVEGRGLPVAPFSYESIANEALLSGSKIIQALFIDQEGKRQALGYCLINTKKESIPDYNFLKETLLASGKISKDDCLVRGLELFVLNVGEHSAIPREFIINKLLKNADREAGRSVIVTKVLACYRHSSEPLLRFGFIDTEIKIDVAGKDNLCDRLLIRRPNSETEKSLVFKKKSLNIEQHELRRLSLALHLPWSADVLVVSGRHQDPALAHLNGILPQSEIFVFTHNKSVIKTVDGLRRIDVDQLNQRKYGGIMELNSLPWELKNVAPENYYKKTLDYLTQRSELLNDNGVLAIRDLLAPDWKEQVKIKIHGVENLTKLRKFLDIEGRWNDLEHLESNNDNFTFKVASKLALRIGFFLNYTKAEMETETKLPYPLFNYKTWQELAEQSNLSLVQITPVYNNGVKQFYLQDKITYYDLDDRELQLPATQVELVLRKTSGTNSRRVLVHDQKIIDSDRHITHKAYYNKATGETRELVDRQVQNPVVILPLFRSLGRTYILIQSNKPRGIIQAQYDVIDASGHADTALDQAFTSGRLSESFAAIPRMGEDINGLSARIISKNFGLDNKSIVKLDVGSEFLPSSGSICEKYLPITIELDPESITQINTQNCGDSGQGEIALVDLQHFVRLSSNQALQSLALTISAYSQLSKEPEGFGLWLGDRLTLRNQDCAELDIIKVAQYFEQNEKNNFRSDWVQVELNPDRSKRFYQCWSANFTEEGSAYNKQLNYVSPSNFSNNTTPMALICKDTDGKIYVGLEKRKDLPITQILLNQQDLLCCHSMRVTREVSQDSDNKLENYLKERLAEMTNGAQVLQLDRFASSVVFDSGLIPERGYPIQAELDVQSLKNSNLLIFELEDLYKNIDQIACGQTRLIIYRLVHAYGINKTS